MKLEMKNVAGEEIPTIIAECLKCGGPIAVRECDFMLSRPLQCRCCHHERFLSYREYVTTFDSIAPKLLAYSVSRIDTRGSCRHRHH